MTLVIGTDEAGYGPNLGPLVIGASVWHVETAAERAEEHLCTAVSDLLATPPPAAPPVVWRDSKEVYRGGSGREALLRSALTAISLAAGSLPQTWHELTTVLGQHAPARSDASPEWQSFSAAPLLDAPQQATITAHTAKLRAGLARRGVRLVSVASRAVYPERFNQLLDSGLNKSDILSQETLSLAADLTETFAVADTPTLIWCDRHGGRKRYSGPITAAFHLPAVPLEETPQQSIYRIATGGLFGGQATRHIQLEFCVQGERRPPVAVASLTAKLIRELAMECFNAFWCQQVPGLAPTAGYPVDANRWREQAGAAIGQQGVPLSAVWREV